MINIITKGLRSRPVVALEKKMAAQLRSTKQALAKDALLLRQLVNQIRVLKIKVNSLYFDLFLSLNLERSFFLTIVHCIIAIAGLQTRQMRCL